MRRGSMTSSVERRRYPRVSGNKVSLKVKTDTFDSTISQSLNISASGVCCKVSEELPMMSRVQIILMLPVVAKENRTKTVKIETDGVVVREHPVIEEGKILHYDVAIFFDSLSAEERDLVKEYVSEYQT